MSIQVERRFEIADWSDLMEWKTLSFWARRGMVFSNVSRNAILGRRGNWLGNLMSSDMSKLVATLTVVVPDHNEVRCVLKVNTLFQIVTEFNRAWWNLELETFETFLLHDNAQDARWQEFLVQHQQASAIWAQSYGRVHMKIPPHEKP